LLRKEYPEHGANIPELRRTRREDSIRAKAKELGIKYSWKWSQQDDDLLREKYSVDGSNIPELLCKFTIAQLRGRATYLGLTVFDSSREWTEEEDALLREKYPVCGTNIQEFKGSRTSSSIIHRARRLGIKTSKAFWSDSDVELLRSRYSLQGTNVPELREKFSRKQIQRKASNLGLQFNGVGTSWTEDELQLVENSYSECTAKELVSKLPGRTEGSLYALVHKQGKQKAKVQKASLFNPDIFGMGTAKAGWYYVVCRKCGRVFLREQSEVEGFAHETEGVAVPEGWKLPYNINVLVRRYKHEV